MVGFPDIMKRLAIAIYLLAATPAVALELQGYTEPYRTINVAADETGTIDAVFVREGETVPAGQPLVRLNSDVYQALLSIARQSMEAQGRLDAARADLQLRQERLDKLQSIRSEGYARQEEVDRAVAELAVAQANLRTAEEDLVTRRLEYEKIQAQIARRTIHAPIQGVVTRLHKDLGEFVAPNSPEILTLVQLDTLLANFTLMSPQAEKLRLGQQLTVRFLTNGSQVTGTVEFIAPVIDAESGTVLVKLRIDNSQGSFRSGERCAIQVGS